MTMSIASFFSPSAETRELHYDAQLKTRYYRNSFKDCLKVIETLAETMNMDIRDVNEKHGEINLIGNGFDAILTVTQVTPIETGIDIKINFFSFVGFGRPKRKVIALYKYFNQNLKFKGVALHP
jgi:hypothetical protein